MCTYWFYTRAKAPVRGDEMFKMNELENVTRKRCWPNPHTTTDLARKIEENPPNPEDYPTQYRAVHLPLSPVYINRRFSNVVAVLDCRKLRARGSYCTCIWCFFYIDQQLAVWRLVIIIDLLVTVEFVCFLGVTTHRGCFFHSPVAGFSLLVFEVSWSHTTTRHIR
jgi:hypothetical protein